MKSNKTFVKLTTGITAIALSLTLTSGCDYKKRDKFYYHPNLRGEMVLEKNSYISLEYIDNYYVIELYHTVLDRSTINIAYRFQYTNGNSKYTNVFTNYLIAYDSSDIDYYNFIKVTPLINFLEEYNLVKDKYTYEDMEEIYEIIKENYVFGEINTKKRKLEINN